MRLRLYSFCVACILAAPVSLASSPPSKSQIPEHIFGGRLNLSSSLNQNLRLEDLIPRTSFYYANNYGIQKDSRLSCIFAGPYQKLNWDYQVSRSSSLTFDIDALIYFAGDSPKIDGEDFNDFFEFRGHRIGSKIGYKRRTFDGTNIEIGYEPKAYYFFKTPKTFGYSRASDFILQGLSFEWKSSRTPSNELRKIGFFPSFRSAYFYRINHNAWGMTGLKREVKSYAEIGLDLSLDIPISKKIILFAKNSGFWISKSDRLNATTGLSLFYQTENDFFRDIKADRSVSAEIGIKFFPNSIKSFAIAPFTRAGIYREVLLFDKRDQNFILGGLRFLAELNSRSTIDLHYGLAYGTDDLRTLVHAAGFNLNYNFIP